MILLSIEKLKEIIEHTDNIVFFGGAGVSTESGIPDFRSANGIYNESTKSAYSPEEILSRSFFTEHTDKFYEFYKTKMVYINSKPNNAHIALAKLEEMGKLKAVITQNIDGLHQLAGSKTVLELHGSVLRNYCMKCHKYFDLSFVLESSQVPKCDICSGIVKPDVVLYQEALDTDVLEDATQYISKADVLIVGGTSLSVYPASGLVSYYKGKKLVLINKSQTPYDGKANLILHDSIGEVLNKVIPKQNC